MLVQVAVAAAVRGIFTYGVPDALQGAIAPGSRVAVPFGRSPRATGYVVGFAAEAPAGVTVRDVVAVLDAFPLFTPELLALVRWAEGYYLSAPGELLRAALPPGLNARAGAAAPRRRGVEYAAPAPAAAEALPALARRARGQHAVLEYLVARGRIPVEELRAAFPAGRAALLALRDKGLAKVESEAPLPEGALLPAPFVLHGVTGSGKTEVYLRAIADSRWRRGAARSCWCRRSRSRRSSRRASAARFGDDVAVLHSGLSERERWRTWRALRRGEARSRSARARRCSRRSRSSA